MKTPYPYQEEAIQLGLTRSALIADECGLGKTLVGLEIVRRRYSTLGGPALIVVPKSTLSQWEKELAELDLPVTRVEGHTPVVPRDGVYLTHYEVLLSLGEHLSHYVWTTIVADEVHRIKNKDAKRTRALKKLRTTRRIGLTGTPVEKSPADLWSILHWLQPGYFNSYWRFCNHYVLYEELHRGKEIYRKIIGGRNQAELGEQLRYLVLQRTKHEVAPQLPGKIIQYVETPMGDFQHALYITVDRSKDIEVDLTPFELEGIVVPNELAKLTLLQMISSHVGLLGAVPEHSSKLDWLDDFLADNPEEVVVIFTRFRGTAIMLRQRYGASLIMGGDRESAEQFLEGRNRILVGTIAAMGEGLNLQRAGTAIFFEAEWSSTKMTQAVDRIHRINITEAKNIIYLVASPIDSLILTAVDRKWSEAELIQNFLRREQ